MESGNTNPCTRSEGTSEAVKRCFFEVKPVLFQNSGFILVVCKEENPAGFLTSMGLTGVDGRGCRYSGCRRCPARAVSIFSTFMGSRLAWRDGSAGETQWCTDCWPILSPGEPLSHAGLVLFLRTETAGDVIMTQFS